MMHRSDFRWPDGSSTRAAEKSVQVARPEKIRPPLRETPDVG
jgi:hypothetical protein